MPEFFRHLFHKECPHGIFWFKRGLKMSAEKLRVVIYTNTCEKKVSYIPATEDINIAIMPFQTADNGLIIVCQNSRIIRRKERIPGSSCEWKDVTLAPKSRNRVQL
ncbi:PilI type IV pilus biogenesis protein [Shigella boydii]|nr:PilI type IV pilus biogenesis protein [Shigella boydii]